jgi:sRNA-binding protein
MATSKKTKKQDIARADELVITIGNLLLGDENVAGDDWTSVSLVVNLDGRRSLFGYLYDAEGNAEPLVLEETDLIDHVEELRGLMAADGEPWKAVMVQFAGEELRFTFDTDGTSWRLDGDNTGAMVEALRPEVVEEQAPKAKKAAPAKKKKPAAKKPVAKKAAPKKKPAPAKKPAKKSRR